MKKEIILIFILQLIYTVTPAQRIVLLEQFTNSGCSVCATHDPATYNYVANNSTQIVAITYHTSFPYFDSMYLENAAESNARTAYYNVVGVPYSIIDGNYYRSSTPSFNTVISSTVTNRAAIAPRYAIIPLQNEINGNILQTSFVFQSLNASNLTDSLRAFIVVIEEDVLKSSYAASPGNNSLTVYNYVMRKMLPTSTGSHLLNKNLNGMDSISFNWNMLHIKSKGELRVVAFIQNLITKEIYNAYLIDPNDVTGINKANLISENTYVFPNPASNLVTVSYPHQNQKINIDVVDYSGRLVRNYAFENQSQSSLNLEGIEQGIYFLRITRDGMEEIKKLIIN